MTKQTKNKRDRLIDAAATLFHQRGPMTTSLADIAKESDIPIGNVYYYFKTKEELVLAVIEKRRASMRQAYEALGANFSDPRERLQQALGFFSNISAEYTKYGCPLGRMVIELGPESMEARKAAASVLDEFVRWSEEQFVALGHETESKGFAISLMAGIEGAAIMAKSYGDEQVFTGEIKRLSDWVQQIPNRNIPMGKFNMA